MRKPSRKSRLAPRVAGCNSMSAFQHAPCRALVSTSASQPSRAQASADTLTSEGQRPERADKPPGEAWRRAEMLSMQFRVYFAGYSSGQSWDGFEFLQRGVQECFWGAEVG